MEPDQITELELRLLLQAIYERYHYDFRGYAPASLRRRVDKARSSMGLESLSQLQDRVLHDEASFTRLLALLTIQVSDLFRDPSHWTAVREHVVPLLRTWPIPRIWIAGVATGEELYSLTILLEEEGLGDRTLVYATDINHAALRSAQAGIYSLDRLQHFSENYRRSGGLRSLSAYYTAAYGGAVFSRGLLDRVVFSDHDLATDSAFSEVQMVSCRNVLIYFDKPLQQRALQLFSESLSHAGFLCLGAKESLPLSLTDTAYQVAVQDERIYKKVGR